MEASLLPKLREPFPPNQISKLPKESRNQIDERKADRSKAINCTICGGWHHKNAVHLDYVGHAALTDRLLDTDLEWSWEPVAFNSEGLPAFDRNGGLWIKLTVCGVTRLGYGSADGKTGGDAVKEIIGDALRNAAMRFGAALDLWHKGDLHTEEEAEPAKPATAHRPPPLQGPIKTRAELRKACGAFVRDLQGCGDSDMLDIVIEANEALIEQVRTEAEFFWKGDGADFLGLEKEIEEAEKRVNEPKVLTGELLESERIALERLNECHTLPRLNIWLQDNQPIIDAADEASKAVMRAAYLAKKKAIETMDRTAA